MGSPRQRLPNREIVGQNDKDLDERELADDSVIWDSISKNYDDHHIGNWHITLAKQAIDWLPLPKGAKLLDLACGTGIYTMIASQAVGTTGVVCAVDHSKAMLAKLQAKKVAARPDSKNILTVSHNVMDLSSSRFLQTLAHRFGGFDRITCLSAMDMLVNQQKRLREWAGFLKLGGRIMLDFPSTDYCVSILRDDLLLAVGETELNDTNHHTWTFPAIRGIFTNTGLTIEKLWRSDSLTGGARWMSQDRDLVLYSTPGIRELFAAHGKQNVVEKFDRLWRHYFSQKQVLYDNYCRAVVIARK